MYSSKFMRINTTIAVTMNTNIYATIIVNTTFSITVNSAVVYLESEDRRIRSGRSWPTA